MNRDQAKEAVRLLRVAEDALTAYREFVNGVGTWRSAITDVTLLDSISDYNEMHDDDQLVLSPDDTMVELMVQGDTVLLGDENGYMWSEFDSDVSDLLAKRRLVADPEQDTLPLGG